MVKSTCVKDSGLQTDAQIFLQSPSKVCLALRLEQIVKYAHLRSVVCPRANRLGAELAELAIRRIAKLERSKRRLHIRCCVSGKTLMAARHASAGRQPAKAHAAFLTTLHVY